MSDPVDIKVEDVTEARLNGVGSFDKFMDAVDKKLQYQYSTDNITGSDYATVYSTALQAVLAQSVQFELQRENAAKQADLTSAQIGLVVEQTTNEGKRGLILDQELLKLKAETDLTLKQIIKIDAEISAINKNNELTDAEIARIPIINSKVEAETSLIEEQVTKVGLENNLLTAEVDRIPLINRRTTAETEVAEATALKIPAETALIGQNTANAIAQNQVITNTATKVRSEENLITARKFSEEANYKDSVDGASVKGQIGKKNSLITGQTDAYKRDAEQKAAKIYADIWNVTRSTNELEAAYILGEKQDNLFNTMEKLLVGIGVGGEISKPDIPGPEDN